MPAAVLTDRICRTAEALSGKVTEYVDTKQRGLALRVSPPSNKSPEGARSWTIRYRIQDGSQRRVSLGGYPTVSLSQARDKALAILAGVAAGSDPASEQKASRARAKSAKLDTIEAIGERYFKDAVNGRHRPNARPKRTSTLSLERYYFDRLVLPAFGSRPVGSLSRTEIQAFVNDMADEHAPSTARQCCIVLQRLYAFAQWHEVTDANPCLHINVPQYNSRERVLTDWEIKGIWAGTAFPIAAPLQLSPGVAIAIRLAAVTLQRRSEVVGIHTREIDRGNRTWTIPGERTKNHRTHMVPLSDLALELVDTALAAVGSESGFLFPSPRDRERTIQPNALTFAFARLAAHVGIKDARPHDLRRTGATNITSERIGIPRFIVSRVLNQMSDRGGAAAVTGVYDRNDYLPEKRRALDAWAALLTELVFGQVRPSNVIALAG